MDLSSRQKLQDALIESEAEKKAITDGFPGILMLLGPDMKARWVNKATENHFPDAVGRSCRDIFCLENGVSSDCAFERSFQTGKIESSVERSGVSGENGGETVFDITASPVKGSNGEVVSIIVIAQNVTEQYSLERQLRHTQKMEAIGTLAGGVAHDFNNVLTPIMGYAEIIRLKMKHDGFRDKAVYDYLDEILKAAKRAKTLVEQVLTFSRGVEKKAVLQYMHPIVKEVMKLMRVTLPSTIVIKEEVDEQCGRVLIDPVQIHQVLINLCTNSSHAMVGNHGELTIKLANAPTTGDGRDWLELAVSDTGCGIERELLDRIFEPYYSTKEKTRGTGMGLAMVHGIISRQGGHINVESEVGVGTTFSIFLPVAQKETAVDQVLSLGELIRGTGHILLVDDEEQVVQVTGEILQSLGYTVVGKTTPQEALRIFAEAPYDFDLLLTDLTMPGLTGLELSEQVKRLRPEIPIILFTGYSDQVSKDAAVLAGIDEYCMKPISMRDLSFIVGKVLGSKTPGILT